MSGTEHRGQSIEAKHIVPLQIPLFQVVTQPQHLIEQALQVLTRRSEVYDADAQTELPVQGCGRQVEAPPLIQAIHDRLTASSPPSTCVR